jgi:hypothetical protein
VVETAVIGRPGEPAWLFLFLVLLFAKYKPQNLNPKSEIGHSMRHRAAEAGRHGPCCAECASRGRRFRR